MILLGLAGAAAAVYYLSDENEDTGLYDVLGGTTALSAVIMLSF